MRGPRSAPARAPVAAEAVHAVWQIDHQEKIVLQEGTLATIDSVSDPVGAATLASRAFGP